MKIMIQSIHDRSNQGMLVTIGDLMIDHLAATMISIANSAYCGNRICFFLYKVYGFHFIDNIGK